jgi:hypothetical protein
MSIHLHSFSGCSPTPLAHYLKALGMLAHPSAQFPGPTAIFALPRFVMPRMKTP